MTDSVPIVSAETLGRLIRAVRIAADLTQVDAAALCGVSAPFLNHLERGKPTAQIGLVLAVCQGLGIRVLGQPPDPVDLSSVRRRRRRRG
jgi:transcriptional regulator with XRE-family HTH domain